MTAVELIRRLHAHRAWANARLLATAEILPVESLQRPFAIGQGSIWKSLLHLYAAEFVWLEALLGNEQAVATGDLPGQLPGNQGGPDACRSPGELRERWAVLQARWDDYLKGLTEWQLDETVYRVSTGSAARPRWGTRRSDILLHVCTHAQYTTAQIINMFRQAGVAELPDVMLITLARQECARRSAAD